MIELNFTDEQFDWLASKMAKSADIDLDSKEIMEFNEHLQKKGVYGITIITDADLYKVVLSAAGLYSFRKMFNFAEENDLLCEVFALMKELRVKIESSVFPLGKLNYK